MHCTNSTQVTCKQKKKYISYDLKNRHSKQYVNTPPTLTVTQVDPKKFPKSTYLILTRPTIFC